LGLELGCRWRIRELRFPGTWGILKPNESKKMKDISGSEKLSSKEFSAAQAKKSPRRGDGKGNRGGENVNLWGNWGPKC